MPKLGLTMTEGLLAEWRVAPGTQVRPGDVLFVVETEKIATEIEATAEGRIETLLVEPGQTVPVGSPVALWTGPAPGGDAGPEHMAAPAEAPVPVAAAPVPAGSSDGRIVATPLARRLARQAGIELSVLRGSGPRGRIKAADVEAASAAAARTPAPAPAPVASAAPRAASGTVRAPTTVERIVADRLSLSKRTIPHFYVLADADVTELEHVRAELNADRTGTRITINHFVIAATAAALRAYPEFACRWTDAGIETLPAGAVGVAVDTPRGLMVPVLRHAGASGIEAIADAAGDVVARARDGRLSPDDMAGASISISNVGMTGAAMLVPIVDPDQSAILGVGAIRSIFRPDAQGRPELRREMGLVLSCDHRVFDGMRAARFLDAIVEALRHPVRAIRTPATSRG
jgi:pyruvate dehydrogenase E2 component (dihydrolipoamide acetyltransferase)